MTKTHRPNPNDLDYLSFVVRNRKVGGFNYWSVADTGDWCADYARGRQLGTEYLAYIGANPTNGNTTLLSCITGSMVENAMAGQRAKGIESGFMRAVNEHTMAAAAMLRTVEAA